MSDQFGNFHATDYKSILVCFSIMCRKIFLNKLVVVWKEMCT
jgi:hypothetical protein